MSVIKKQLNLKMEKSVGICLVLVLFSFVFATTNESEPNEESKRKGKILNLFSIVRFPNSVCAGDALNGTCYAAEECSSRGGVQSGTCASGYGVCCTCEYIYYFTQKYIFHCIFNSFSSEKLWRYFV